MKGLDIISRRATVTIAFTADQWELFDEPGRDEAAEELNRTLQDAVNAEGATAESVRTAMGPVCSKLGHLGADDGEADHLIERVIDKAFPED